MPPYPFFGETALRKGEHNNFNFFKHQTMKTNEMENTKFSIDDLSVLNQDAMSNDELSNILGGFLWISRGCKCKCDSGNCFKDREEREE